MRVSPIKIEWHPGLSICASEAFLKTVGSEYGWLGGFDAADKLRCVLPFTIVRKAILRMVRFRVETIPVSGDLDLEQETQFLQKVVEHFRAQNVDMIVPASANALFRVCPEGAISAPYGSFVVDLTQPEETLWANLHSKHRNVVRSAMKNGVQICTGPEHLEVVYETVRDTLARSKMGFMSQGEFRKFAASLGENLKLFVAIHEGRVQGCAALPFSQHAAYYLYGGSATGPVTGAMNFLHWEAMRQFRSLGVQRYDFVGARINPEKGSKQEGLLMFKERFGGRLNQGFMWKYHFRPLKSFVYSLAARLKSGGDVVDQERRASAAAAATMAPAHSTA